MGWRCLQGLPEGTEQDARSSGGFNGYRGLYSSSEQQFLRNLERWQVPRSRVRVLRGWFNETLTSADIGRIAFLRLDGDLYGSTMDALQALYDKVSVGGMVYADDYGSFPGCKRAIDEFRATRRIAAPLQWQYLPDVLFNETEAGRRGGFKWEAVWWVKTEE
jgi:O-methyltransferase